MENRKRVQELGTVDLSLNPKTKSLRLQKDLLPSPAPLKKPDVHTQEHENMQKKIGRPAIYCKCTTAQKPICECAKFQEVLFCLSVFNPEYAPKTAPNANCDNSVSNPLAGRLEKRFEMKILEAQPSSSMQKKIGRPAIYCKCTTAQKPICECAKYQEVLFCLSVFNPEYAPKTAPNANCDNSVSNPLAGRLEKRFEDE